MKKNIMKKVAFLILSVLLVAICAVGCGKKDDEDEGETKQNEKKTTEALDMTGRLDAAAEITVKLDTTKKYQTIKGFGASGCWWSQAVGGWQKTQKNGMTTRDWIAQLLFDKNEGIGLNIYRYNIGGGSQETPNEKITDVWRRAYCFETAPGVYDWNKDANAVWYMNKAKEMGVDDIIMFSNSPITRLTTNGNAYCTKGVSNLKPENYEAFAKYFLDVTEHFINEGLPIKEISPLNEPVWEWEGGQEGLHLTPTEVVNITKVFLTEMAKRPAFANIRLVAQDAGAWDNYNFHNAILADPVLKEYYTKEGFDCHSYGPDAAGKATFKRYLENKGLGNMPLNMSEWCELKNGKDYTMDSALVMAQVINDDLTILSCESWQYWIAVSCYDYRDGLIYVTLSNEIVVIPKRLWVMGNFSKYIRKGYVRVDTMATSSATSTIKLQGVAVSAYTGNNGTEDELVVVVTNTTKNDKKFNIDAIRGDYKKSVKMYVTDKDTNLEDCASDRISGSNALIGSQSVTTFVFTK